MIKMLHIANPQQLLNEQSDPTGNISMKNYRAYEKKLYDYRLDTIDRLRVIVPRARIKECGTMASGGIFISISGNIEDLEECLRDNEWFTGVSIREVA